MHTCIVLHETLGVNTSCAVYISTQTGSKCTIVRLFMGVKALMLLYIYMKYMYRLYTVFEHTKYKGREMVQYSSIRRQYMDERFVVG